jgi:hypothetical protein
MPKISNILPKRLRNIDSQGRNYKTFSGKILTKSVLFLIIWATRMPNISVNYAKTGCVTLTHRANTIKPFTAKFTYKIWTITVPKLSVNYAPKRLNHIDSWVKFLLEKFTKSVLFLIILTILLAKISVNYEKMAVLH